MKNINYQGDKASDVFRGKGQSDASRLFYSESANLFAEAIKDKLKPGKYNLVDLGGHKGEFLGEVMGKLSEYSFEATVIDVVEGLDLDVQTLKIQGDIRNTGLSDKSVDLVLMRYVLAWNDFDNQKSVLKEIARICRGVCIIQHQGADSENPTPLQTAATKLFAGDVIPQLKRDHGSFTEPKQLEKWLDELGVRYTKIQERKVVPVSDTLIEKFALTEEEAEKVRKALEGCDYIIQCSYVLDFRE